MLVTGHLNQLSDFQLHLPHLRLLPKTRKCDIRDQDAKRVELRLSPHISFYYSPSCPMVVRASKRHGSERRATNVVVGVEARGCKRRDEVQHVFPVMVVLDVERLERWEEPFGFSVDRDRLRQVLQEGCIGSKLLDFSRCQEEGTHKKMCY